ncbi:MAG: MotA/TolQ/ExbB proton channel family protein [Bacteroidia bacterium]
MNTPFLLQLSVAGDTTKVVAQAANESAAVISEISLWELAKAGGWYIMIPLAICSVLAVYIFIERFLAIQKALKGEKSFMENIKNYIKQGNLDGAKNLCITTSNPMARMVGKGISRIGKPMKDIAASVENVGKLEISNLEQRLGVLATISGVAPMLGFLGTVIGMISTFHTMTLEGVEIDSLAGGIMQAMVTTVAGLVVGIVAFVAYNYLVSKVEKVIHQMEGASIEFLDILEEPGN